ncbi:cupin domain-containing protein [Edaphobacter acidisoli]|nr:cupin domain-containing protein [Edaphobacter acidisoli]
MTISKDTAEHYLWGQGCDGWHLVRTPELSVIEERMPPGTSEARHYHVRARQFFYVLEGELTMEVERSFHTLRAGEGVEIAPGMAHQAFNRSGSDVRFLVTSHPPSHGDRVACE